jgi:type I restriction enzyme S subunit
MTRLPAGWIEYKFGDVTTSSQYGLSCVASAKGETPMLRMNNIVDGKLINANLIYVSLSDKELEAYRLKRGDLLFNRTNSYDLVGKTALFDLEGEFVCASYLVRFQLDKRKVYPSFINYFFNSLESHTRLRKLATKGVSQSNINPTILKNRFTVVVPPLLEQRGIVEVLSSWDIAIEHTEKLIAAKIKRKHGLMQQLLSGKKRFQHFAGQEWKRLTISDFTIPAIRVRTKPDKAFLALGIRSHGKGTFLKPDFDPAKIEMTELYEVKENDLIVNITFAWEGAVAIAGANDTGALVSHRFPTFEFKTKLAIPEYFRHVIVQKWFVQRLGLISPGGAGRNRVLSKRDFGKLEVLMPSVEEQRCIAKVLNACDKEIDLLKQQLDAVKRQKQGLMQKLLTGQIRVKVDEFEAATVEAS